MKKSLIAFAAVAASFAAVADSAVFSFESSGYSDGEPLSSKGVTGASWQMTGDAPVFQDGGFDVGGESVGLKASGEFATTDERTVEFTVRSEASGGVPPVPSNVSAALVPDASVFYGLGEGRWQTLTAEGFAWTEGDWTTCRFAVRTVGGRRCVSYFVKSGEEWLALAAADGRTSFGIAQEGAQPEAGVSGPGAFSAIACRDAAAQVGTQFQWVGGDAGDWGDTNNWQVAGAVATRAPGAAGDVAVVSGAVTLTRDGETADVKDLAVDFAAGEGKVAAGAVQTAVTLDTDQPKAGTALEAKVDALFGVETPYAFAWTKQEPQKKKAATSVGSAAAYVPTAADYENWLKLTAARLESAPYPDGAPASKTFEIFFSKLPVCYLTTDDGQEPSMEKEKHDGRVRVQGNDEFKMQYDGAMTINVRGNSTKWYPKKAYKLKLDKKANMFKLGKEKSKNWVLLANYNDMSAMRNKLAYDLANDIGNLGMHSTWAVCTLNGDYRGVYQFSEDIRPADDRVPVKDWEKIVEDELGGTKEDLSGIDTNVYDVAGGYIFEFSSEADEVSCFTNRSGKLAMQTMMKAPEYLVTNPDMFNWCVGFMQNYWDACTSASRRSNEGKHYSEYCDVDSMVTFFIVNEFFTNLDDCEKSRYAYLADGEKLKFGPVWDFDWGSQSVRVPKDDTDRWMCLGESHNERKDDGRADENSMIKEWASDPYFARLACKKYWAIRDKLVDIVKDGGTIDTYAAFLDAARRADDAKWNAKRSDDIQRTSTDDTAILKANLTRRIAWFDKQFESTWTLLKSMRSEIQTNPWQSHGGTIMIVR